MDIVRDLAVIDRLCLREFPEAYGRTDVGAGGPGYLIAELRTSGDFYEDDGSDGEETAAQFEAERDALGLLLAERWGETHAFGLGGVFLRSQEGENIPEPWATLAAHVPDVQAWHTDSGRWVALGVSHWGAELPLQLLAVVTETEPP
ncbi:hypothetical protein KUM39_23155 [Streptomyces sp. J2-1]|uniref:hypothetical protein n=1 Tax=Streptomyces corallincola TaxID=2851888 RepID=UPI001C381DC5|nr:hypothetical protein [Streptomyces corallincola]MBV2357237.1 hypothetical protein [Streptomyces corallincola]